MERHHSSLYAPQTCVAPGCVVHGRSETPVNDLQYFLRITRGCETFYMSLCQDRAFISDNCISAADVCLSDASAAVERIMKRPLSKVISWLESGFNKGS